MTAQQNPPTWGPPASRPLPPSDPPKKRKRIFMWTFLIVQVIFLVWLVTGITAVSGGPEDCGTLSAQDCSDAHAAGATIGVGLIIGLWAAVDLILGVTYAVVRLARRGRS